MEEDADWTETRLVRINPSRSRDLVVLGRRDAERQVVWSQGRKGMDKDIEDRYR